MPLKTESCTLGSMVCHILPSKEELLEAVGGGELVPIVVLGQSLQPDGTASRVLTNRIALATELHQLLGRDRAPLVVSGTDAAGVGETEGSLMRRLLLATGKVEERSVHVDEEARDTLQNAVHTLPILQRLGSARFVLLTSDFHTPRSALLFQGVFSASPGAPSMTMYCIGAESGHPNTPARDPPPWEVWGGDINSWGFADRCGHERMLLERKMPAWFERRGLPVPPPESFAVALEQLAWLRDAGGA